MFDGIWKKVGRAVAGLNSEYSGNDGKGVMNLTVCLPNVMNTVLVNIFVNGNQG